MPSHSEKNMSLKFYVTSLQELVDQEARTRFSS